MPRGLPTRTTCREPWLGHSGHTFMPRKCAYCGSSGRLTREHVWPKCIIERLPSYQDRFIGRGNRVISGEQTVADVCQSCNSGPLSALDAYLCDLFDQYFARFYGPADSVEFAYDWYQLGNWFLKASYNAVRAAGNHSDAEILSLSVRSILSEGEIKPDISIFVDLVLPDYLATETDSGILTANKIPPAMVRLAKVTVPNTTWEHYVLRLVAINSFYFYLAIPVLPYSTPHLEELAAICAMFSGASTVLDPDKSRATIRPSGHSFASMILPHFLANEVAYRQTHDARRTTLK